MNEGKPGMDGEAALIIPMIPDNIARNRTPGDHGVEYRDRVNEIQRGDQNPVLSPIYSGFCLESQP